MNTSFCTISRSIESVAVDTARDALPEDIAALKEALLIERARALEVAAELAVARAKASEDVALNPVGGRDRPDHIGAACCRGEGQISGLHKLGDV